MSIRPFILGLALASPALAQAAHTVTDSVFTCTAAMSFSNTASLVGYCAGNFTISGGAWTSDTRIDLSAAGDITLDGVTMTAPIIDLQSLTQVTLTSTTVLSTTSTLRIQAPGSTAPLNPGSDVNGGAGVTANNPRVAGEVFIRVDPPVLQQASGSISQQPTPYTLTTTAVPEPETWALALAALGTGAAASLPRRRKA